jgi:hypothetical protein
MIKKNKYHPLEVSITRPERILISGSSRGDADRRYDQKYGAVKWRIEMMDFSWVKKGIRVELMHYSGKIYYGIVECEPFPVGKQGYLRTRLCGMDAEYVMDFGCRVHPLADLRRLRPASETEKENTNDK